MASLQARLWLADIRTALPRGGVLPEGAWQARHRGICALLWVQVVALSLIGLLRHEPLMIWLLEPEIVAAFTVAAMWGGFSQTVRSSMATLGLLCCSAILIQFFNGLIEAHFHFFVIIAVVSLYQAWTPYLLAVGFVLVHHLLTGTMAPELVYNHHMAHEHPWLFAGVHGIAVLAESAACLVFWRVTEDALDAERANGEALERSNIELSQANRAVADLVAMLSHDLRVPLAVVIGYSEMALESWPKMSEEAQIDFVRKVSVAGQRLHAMLDDTLTVSALDADGVDPRRVPVRVDDAVRAVLAALPDPLPAVDLGQLEPVTALVDRGHLDQVLANLFTNAVKYGGGSFAVHSRQDGDSVCVEIRDNGLGVSPDFVPQLFDRFTRAEEARAGLQKGTGLGLYITQSLLIANAGAIRYEATEGGGASFSLRLELAPAERNSLVSAGDQSSK